MSRHRSRFALVCLVGAALGGGAAAQEDPFLDRKASRLDVLEDYADRSSIGAHLVDTPIDRRLAPWFDFKVRLQQRYGLRFDLAYSPLAQFGSHSQRRFNANQTLDLVAQWKLLDHPVLGRGALQMNLRQTVRMSGPDVSQFAVAIGSGYELNDGDISEHRSRESIEFLWWRHLLAGDRLTLAVGKIDPIALVGDNRFAGDDRESFLAAPLSARPALPLFEIPGLGAFAEWTERRFAVAVLALDAEARRNGVDFDSLGNGNLHLALQLEWTPFFEGVGQGNYGVVLNRTDRTGPEEADDGGEGLLLSFDQDLGDAWGATFLYARSWNRKLDLRQYVSAGMTWKRPFGFGHDRLGVAFIWADPVEARARDQYGLEVYWRFQLTRQTEITPDLQVFRRARGNGFEAAGGLRIRIRI